MLALIAVTALVVSIVNQYNLRRIYENNLTERALLSNNLMATLVNSEDIQYFVDLLTNKPAEFKQKQLGFFNDKNELFALRDQNADPQRQAILLHRIQAFHQDMQSMKTDLYWSIQKSLRQLRDMNHAKYAYILADTGVKTEGGKKLYTYIFDADDDGVYEIPENDGLGTVHIGEDIIDEIYRTKKPMETVQYENSDYGELYFAYSPVLDKNSNVIAILGTDMVLAQMRDEISKSTVSFNMVFLSFAFITIVLIYVFISQYVTNPLQELTATALQLAAGDVYSYVPQSVLKQRTELGMLARAVDDMSAVIRTMIKSTEELFAATKSGRLEVRNDVTEYKGDIKKVIQQINDTLDSMTLYLNGIPEGIFIMDRNFDMHFRNSQFAAFFGNIGASDFMSMVFPENREELFARLMAQPDSSITIWLHDRCYTVTFKEIAAGEDKITSTLVIVIDITDLIREQEKAQAAAKAKSDFLSRMSHEMRTPMNAIIGMTKIAENTEDVSKLKYCLNTIGSSSALLLGIINDVLDMTKIDAGKFVLEVMPFNIEKMLIKIDDIIRESAIKKNQNFDVLMAKNIHMDFIGDELRLSQVITNLLSNAVKFTPENGSITLKVDELERKSSCSIMNFSVSDTGIGISKEQIDRLFTSFEQADGSITRRFGGTGLGLAISKSIVEKMDGEIWVTSEYGKGSVFAFNVKLEHNAIQEVPRQDAVKTEVIPDFSGLRILLTEDVEINREIFVALMEPTGIVIDTAENGAIAVAKFKENPDRYDMIIMDIQMPEMDGFQATKTIRAYEEELYSAQGAPDHRRIPIVAMTANAFREDIENCLKSGMNDHLAKPIDEKAVYEKIKQYTA